MNQPEETGRLMAEDVLRLIARGFEDLHQENKQLKEQLADAEDALDEATGALDAYYIMPGEYATPKGMAYDRKWRPDNAT